MTRISDGLPAGRAVAEGPQNPVADAYRLLAGLTLSTPSSAYQEWVNAGQPWNTAQPVADLATTLRSHGYTVYVLGDTSHLTARTPEDHTPFSATGWPNASPRWWVHACDIMPPPAGSGLPTLTQLAGQIVGDRQGGAAPWLKYLNWTHGDGWCVHESWEPGHNVTSSNDTGHIHISVRSDYTRSAAASGYDPVVRFHGGTNPVTPGNTPGQSAPPWPGRYLTYTPGHQMMSGPDVRQWQQRMKDRRWTIDVDNWYGGQSSSICGQFQLEKRLRVDRVVGPVTWAATWELTIT